MFEKNLKGSWSSRSNNDIARDRFISLLRFALTSPSVTILTRFTKSDMSFASSSQQQLRRKPMFGQIFPPIRSYRVHNLFSCSIVAWQFYKYVSKPQQRQLNFSSYNESAKKFGRIKKRKFFEDFTITDLTSCCCCCCCCCWDVGAVVAVIVAVEQRQT